MKGPWIHPPSVKKIQSIQYSTMDSGNFVQMKIPELIGPKDLLYTILEIPAFPRNGIWKTAIVFSKFRLNEHNQCM